MQLCNCVKILAILVLFTFLGVCSEEVQADNLTWVTTQQEAFDLAGQQGKKVLLLAGRDT